MSARRPERVAVVGLGYVGLPLAVAFARVGVPTIGFDIDPERVAALRTGRDHNGEVDEGALRSPNLSFTADEEALGSVSCFLVTVPTPVDRANRPDLSALVHASGVVGRAIASMARKTSGAKEPGEQHPLPMVVYESTVYPGCTEEICVPVVEEASGGSCGATFKVAYSPERINPGDKEHTLERVVKVVAGQDADASERVRQLYSLVVKAGVYVAANIRTAEAAKVIENIQRDQNIASINEIAMLLHRLGLNTRDVLDAARTKWNFLPFEPGLVGGHCIPVDSYYLAHKAQEIGYHPELILAGRRINDQMGTYVAQETIRLLAKVKGPLEARRILVLGLTFKENVRDIRATRVLDLVRTLEEYGMDVSVYDPLLPDDVLLRAGVVPVSDPFEGADTYDAVVLAVAHDSLRRSANDYLRLLRSDGSPGVVVDVKGVLPAELRSAPGVTYWSL